MTAKKSFYLLLIFSIGIIQSCSKSDIIKPPKTNNEVVRGIKLTNVDSKGMMSKSNLQKVVNDCLEIGINTAPAMILNTGDQFVSENDLKEMLSYNRSRGFKGEAFFFYGALEKKPSFKTILKEHYQKYN